MTQKNVAIFIFDEVEVLDFAGPFEVFAVSRDEDDVRLFNVYTVGQTGTTITARHGLSVNPAYSFENMPRPDIALIPGGRGTRMLMHNQPVLDWIKQQYAQVELLLSVCTGSLLLGRAGLLDGLSATTYHTEIDLLAEAAPGATVCPGERFVDNGKIVTSAGISAGIDMSFHIVARLHGEAMARRTAQLMEYEYYPRPAMSPASE